MTPITWTAALVAAASLAGGALPDAVDRSASTPDFCQTDPAADFGGKGGVFCGPVAVANSLMYLAESGFPKVRPDASTDKEAQIALVQRLAAREFMDAATRNGTSTPRLMAGVQRLVEQAGYQVVRLEQQGWRERTRQFPAQAEIPSLDWIREGLAADSGAVWLNVGWYKFNPETREYHRFAGHWVTLVGYGKDRDDADEPPVLLIHDPAPRTGMEPLTQRVRLAVIDEGILQRNLTADKVRRRDAAGFFEMKGEMKLKPGADAAILDTAVVLLVK